MSYDYTSRCPFPKHEGKLWTEVADEDPEYLMWLIMNDDSPVELHSLLMDFLTELAEGEDYWDG